MGVDLAALLCIFSSVYMWRYGALATDFWSSPGLWFILITTLSSLYILGTYDLEENSNIFNLAAKLIIAVLLGISATLFIHYFFAKSRIGLFGRMTFLGSFSVFWVFAMTYRAVVQKWYHHRLSNSRWLFVVHQSLLDVIQKDLQHHAFQGEVSFLTEKVSTSEKVLGTWNDVDSLLDKSWSSVIVAIDSLEGGTRDLFTKLMEARFKGHTVMDLSHFYEGMWRKVPVHYLSHEWFVNAEGFGILGDRISMKIKRLADLFFSTGLLLIVWPLMLLTALAIRLESKGPVLYRQVRTGRSGVNFTIFKFRSMRLDAEKDGAVWAQKNDSRVTFVGKWIRQTRLDELPQLFNVFRGEMSFIGPRPERPEFNEILAKKIPYYNLRHTVSPGITGWAQVLYPYGASEEDAKEKLQYDLFYIRHHSLLFDLVIVLKTINVVLMGKGR